MSHSNSKPYNIRKAKKEDAFQIFELIKDLAVFEKCPDKVTISAEQFQRDGFGNPPAYECFVAETSPGTFVGFALYFQRYSTWYGKTFFLEDLYVKPDYRGFGIGKQFIKALAKVALERDFKRIDFHVLKWNPAKEFYKKLGAVNATETEDFEIYRFYETAIKELSK